MGQYYILVNKTKKQFIYPHELMPGVAKAWEIARNHGASSALCLLLTKSKGGVGSGDFEDTNWVGSWIDDEVFFVGDYDSSDLYNIAYETYTNISDEIKKLLKKENLL